MSARRSVLSGLAILTAAYFFLAAAGAVRVARHENECSRLIGQIASRQDLNHVTNADVNLHPARMGMVTSFILRHSQKGIVSRRQAAENQSLLGDEIDQLTTAVRASSGDSLALIAVTLIYLLAARRGFGRESRAPQPRIYALLAASLIFFVLGISCPVLTAVVKGEHLLVGGFIIQVASKGIVSTVVSLCESGSGWIGVLLAGFSIGIPLFKAGAVLLASLSRSHRRRTRIGHALESIGKWSLADVVVAAVLLGCFSLNAIQESNGGVVAVPRFALGFFIGYCALAAGTSLLLRRTGEAAAAPGAPPPAGRVLCSGLLLVTALVGGAATGAALHADLSVRNPPAESALMKLIRPPDAANGGQGEK